MDEARMCQFLALLDEKWGRLEGAKPKLSIVREHPEKRRVMAKPSRASMLAWRREAEAAKRRTGFG